MKIKFNAVIDLPNDIDIEAQRIEAMQLVANIYDAESVKRDIQFLKTIRINGKKISTRYIAERVGVNRRNIYYWLKGQYYPLNPLPLLEVRLWAQKMREEIQRRQSEQVKKISQVAY